MAKIEATVNFEFLENLPESANIAVLEGSTRSSKTISILQYLIMWCLEDPGVVIRCFRHDSATLDKTVIPDFKWVMQGEQLDVWDQGNFNKVDKQFNFDNGSIFSFAGANDPQKLQGCKQNVAWLNEAMEIHEKAWAQIAFRTTDLSIMDYNPSFNHHWVFSTILTRPDVAYKHSTYKANPFLSDGQIIEIEKYDPNQRVNIERGTADSYLWDVYGCGKRGKVDGAIYELWEVTDEWPEDHACGRRGYGMDFGFSNDPTALIDCRVYNGALYLREKIYDHGLLITPNVTRPEVPSIEGHLRDLGISKDDKIYADCAMPSAISDLQISGYNCLPCVKGKDSIINGINLLKSYKIFVHRGSHNIQTELEHYTWHKKADGTQTRVPIDNYNHALDAVRYWAMQELQIQKYQDNRAKRGKGGKPKVKRGF